MNTSQISRVEFEGGPEDGLILDAGLFRNLETIGTLDSPGSIPMLVREEIEDGPVELASPLIDLRVLFGKLRALASPAGGPP